MTAPDADPINQWLELNLSFFIYHRTPESRSVWVSYRWPGFNSCCGIRKAILPTLLQYSRMNVFVHKLQASFYHGLLKSY